MSFQMTIWTLGFSVLLCTTTTNALPVAPELAAPVSPLGLSLVFLPFPVLLATKLLYVWYRRAQSIHEDADDSRSPTISQSSLQVPCSFFETGYLVGFLGSPDWEMRIKCRRDVLERKASRKSSPTSKNSSSVSRSRTLADSTVTSHGRSTVKSSYKSSRGRRSQSHSRTMSLSYLDLSSPAPHLDITSCANVHPGSPPCSPVLPSRPPSATRVSKTTKSPSPTLMQMMEPVLSSWYEGPPQSQDKSTSSAANTSTSMVANASRASGGADLSQSSKSRSPDFHTPPTSPNTPFIPETAQVTLNVAISTPQLQASSSLTFSVFEAPSVPVPAPVYTPSRRSYNITPEEWIAGAEHILPTSFDTSINTQSSTPNILQLVANVMNQKPLITTTRPLNVTSKSKPGTPEDSPVLPAELRPPLLAIKRSVVQKRKSMSPPIGPSPLRNVLVPQSISGSMNSLSIVSGAHVSDNISRSPSGDWGLDDLVRDGRLDVDAVRAALGLGLTCPCDDDASSIGTIPSIYDAEDGHQEQDVPASPTVEDVDAEGIVGWGRTRDSGVSVQFHIAGTQLSTIVEESEAGSVRLSRAASQIDLRLLGLDRKEADHGEEPRWESVWDAEVSWVEGASVSRSESVGVAR